MIDATLNKMRLKMSVCEFGAAIALKLFNFAGELVFYKKIKPQKSINKFRLSL